ncbi:hypothetical protein WA026_012467, partial [Henosepilachna vigintioctopunctata]
RVFRSNKIDTSEVQEIYKLPDAAVNLMVYDPDKRKGTNQCAISNGGCSHLCLTLPGKNPDEPVTFTCACPTHYTLQENRCIRKLMLMWTA